MNRRIVSQVGLLPVFLLAVTAGLQAAGPVGTGLQYQGRLKMNGNLVAGATDLRFSLWKDATSTDPKDQIGATIEIPAREEALRLVEAAATAGAARATPPPTRPGSQPGQAGRATYVVERGDSLIKIARNVLHDASRWQEIYELNRDELESPHLLRIGMELRLPPLEKKEVPAEKTDED